MERYILNDIDKMEEYLKKTRQGKYSYKYKTKLVINGIINIIALTIIITVSVIPAALMWNITMPETFLERLAMVILGAILSILCFFGICLTLNEILNKPSSK